MTPGTSPINWYQSATIRNALGVILVQALAIASEVTGKVYDIDQIRFLVDNGLPVAFDLISVFLGWRAIKSRVNATETIDKSTLPLKRTP